jgi:hypothetical protein
VTSILFDHVQPVQWAIELDELASIGQTPDVDRGESEGVGERRERSVGPVIVSGVEDHLPAVVVVRVSLDVDGEHGVERLDDVAPGSRRATHSLPVSLSGSTLPAYDGWYCANWLVATTTTRPDQSSTCSPTSGTVTNGTASTTSSASAARRTVPGAAASPSSETIPPRLAVPRLLLSTTGIPAARQRLATACPTAPDPIIPTLLNISTASCY